MAKTENIIEVKNLKKYFKKTKAVDGVTFGVKKGEVFGFLGPNGAGKTTTIRLMMDFIRPTEGSVKIFNQEIGSNSTLIRSDIGYLPGNVELYGHWTGHDHIKYVESFKSKSENVPKLIERLDFDPNKKFATLSSGNKQKLGLILALMNKPKLLIMDEPTVGLDPLLQNEIYKIIDELKKTDTTIFVSSHNLPEVERICDRVGIIRDGKLVELSDIDKLSGKRLSIIRVTFEGSYKKADFEFDGAEKVEDIGNGLEITVGGDYRPILKKISDSSIKDIEIHKASLEEIFLKFYEREK
ncbi:ABC transporter ATP-binding protein [Patescibacteria group bacterium]|nr:ABC transporter ATP-binding protein [Patescibacteria group bacterium]